jgi:hypothetical protein
MVERQLDVGGAVTFWSLADWSNREQLQSAFAHHNLEAFMPEPRPSSAALKDALQEVLGGPRVLVRPLASRDGFAVVREDRGSDRNAYATQLVAHVHEGNHPTFEPWSPVADRVMEVFRKQLGRVSGMQLSGALVKIVDALGGTRLRPSGAVYWVPGNRIHEWSQIAQSVERATEGRASSVYVLRHRLDADAVRAVRDAVVLEVQTEAKRICEDGVRRRTRHSRPGKPTQTRRSTP